MVLRHKNNVTEDGRRKGGLQGGESHPVFCFFLKKQGGQGGKAPPCLTLDKR